MPPEKPYLFQREFATEAPTGPDGLSDELRAAIVEKRASFIAKLAAGQCKSMESYADAVGAIRSLNFVLGFAEQRRRELEPPAITDQDED